MKITFEQISDRDTDLIRRAFGIFLRHNPGLQFKGIYTNGIRKIKGREYIAIRQGKFDNILAVFRVTTEGYLRSIIRKWPEDLKNR